MTTYEDWETPPEVARFMGSLVTEDEQTILEPSAGTGAIVRHLPRDRKVSCYELNLSRLEKGRSENYDCTDEWRHADFLKQSELLKEYHRGYDLVVGNPPFALGMEFLLASASVIKESGRILFLFPTSFLQSQGRARKLRESGLIITKQWPIIGRVGFLRDGKVEKKRQCYDAVFEFKRVGKPALTLVDVYMRLGGFD